MKANLPANPERTLLTAAQADEPGRPVYRLLLILAASILLILPFVTTFNEFLTRMVISLGLDRILEGWVVPMEVRLIAAILQVFGLPATVSPTSVYLDTGNGPLAIYISWNCVGWQSFILFALTLVTGLQGPFTRRSKVEAVILGILGTFLINLIRISVIVLLAYHWGQLPALLVHDYGGTLFILLWLVGYWYFCHQYFLEPEDPDEGDQGEPALPLRAARPQAFAGWLPRGWRWPWRGRASKGDGKEVGT